MYIFTHISPGLVEFLRSDNYYHPQYNGRFLELLQTYGEVILGVFTAHSHMDSFKMVYRHGRWLRRVGEGREGEEGKGEGGREGGGRGGGGRETEGEGRKRGRWREREREREKEREREMF